MFGLFAFLGKETRSFFTKMKIIYLDEEVEEFLRQTSLSIRQS